MTIDKNGGVNIDALRTLYRDLYTPDSIAALGVGSRFNGYYKPDSDIDLGIITRKTTGIKYLQVDGFPGLINIAYVAEDLLENFSIRRRSGLPIRVVPLINEDYVDKLALDTKTEIVKRVASKYQKLAGEGVSVRVPILLPVTEDILNRGSIEYWRIPTFVRTLASRDTAYILREEYALVFDNLANEGFFTKFGDDDYRINHDQVLDDAGLNDSKIKLLRVGTKAIGFGLALTVGRQAFASLPHKGSLRRRLKEAANNFAGVDYFS